MSENKKFYGYKAIVALCILNFFSFALLGVYACILPELMTRLNANETQVSSIATVYTITCFGISFFAGKIYEKLGANKCMILYGLLTIAYAAATIFSPGFSIIYIVSALYGISMGVGNRAGVNQVVAEWFIDKRDSIIGYITGIGTFEISTGSMLYGILVGSLGPHTTATILLAAFGILIILSTFFLKSPKQLKQKPLGYEKIANADSEDTADIVLSGVDAKTALRSVSFILICLMSAITGIVAVINSSLMLIATNVGFNVATAAKLYTLFTVCSGITSLLIGKVKEKFGHTVYLSFSIIFFTTGYVLLYLWAKNAMGTAMLAAALVVMGMGAAGTQMIAAYTVPHIFGMKSFATVMPIVSSLVMLGVGAAAFILPPMAAADGNWNRAILTAIIMLVIGSAGTVIALIASPLKKSSKEN